MRGYKRIKIAKNFYSEEDKEDEIQSKAFLENNYIKLVVIFIIIIISLLCFIFYLIFHNNETTQEKQKEPIIQIEKKEKVEMNETIVKNESEMNIVQTNMILNNSITEKNNSAENISNAKERNLTDEIIKYEDSLRSITEDEIAEFHELNNLYILFDKTKYERKENPDISVVITVRNQAHCIGKAIRSVQNQSLKNIEIIIVDDCSLDNSTETIEQYMKEDDRIILLKHEDTNEGIMITRNEGIRKAKGQYITLLDADDNFIHRDILKFSLHVANIANLDVVEFKSAYYSKKQFKGYYHSHGKNPIIYQPELRNKFIVFDEEDEMVRAIKCRTVWGKIVRNEILQKTLDNIPEKYLNDYILGFEDTMITTSLYQVAQSYYGMRQPGYYYTFDEKRYRYPRKNKVCKKKEGIIEGIDHIKFLQFLIDKLEDNEFEKQIIYHELKAINKYEYSNFKKTITHHFDLAYKIFDELINSNYLTIKQKEKVLKIKEEVKENEMNQKKDS